MPVTDIAQLNPDAIYTYADYLQWKFDEYVELFRGKLMKMSPAPNRLHQKRAGSIFSRLEQHLRGKGCDVYISPFDVRLPKTKEQVSDKQIYTVVQPDICIVCDPSKLDDRGCLGAPDTIIEVISKGNTARDITWKHQLYQEHGVPEYWIVFPAEKNIVVYLLQDGKYVAAGEYGEPGPVPVHSLPGFSLEWEDIFRD